MKKIIHIFVVIILFLTISNAQNNRWQVVDSMPFPVFGGEAIALDSTIAILGGYSDSVGTFINLIQIYDPYNNSWTVFASLAEYRSSFVSDLYADSVVLSFGGIWYPTNNLYSIEMWDFRNPTAPSQIYDLDVNFNRVYAQGHIYNDNLYVIGGFPSPASSDSIYLPYIAEYNIPSKIITNTYNAGFSIGLMPFDQMSALVNNNIYIFGGVFFGVIDDIVRYNINANNHQVLGNLVNPRAGGEAVVSNDLIYIIGGYDETDTTLNSVEIYNTQTDSLWLGSSLIFPRQNLMATKLGNSIYVFGGKDGYGYPIPAIERLDLVTNIIDTSPTIAENFTLENNYPNPFNATTMIKFNLPKKSAISLDIFTITGQHIKNIIHTSVPAGNHKFRWDGKDKFNRDVASGIYIYQLKNERQTISKKMILLR